MTEKNPYKDYEFLAKARSQVDRSNIIIINHSLLFSDLKGENSVL
jgi:Rad3-related DNA helicase|tara:strand:+ start:817 stop:951 length:135 start_codon:yes stop_codon:yes gene_type:complete